jgi:cyanophycinase
MSEQEAGEAHPGSLFAIGGAEDKLKKRSLLRQFVAAAGGDEARIVVVPTASALGPEIIEVYAAVFGTLGAKEVAAVRPETRADADNPASAGSLDRATGIFMTGGNQLKLSVVVAGTTFGEAIRAAHRRGVTVGGTSAGASVLAEHMIAFGRPGSTPRQRMGQLAAGLGLVSQAIIDQHFAQRNRYGRLLSLVAQSPALLGIGVDEDTAAIIDGDLLRVAGRSVVTILDGSRTVSNVHSAQRSAPLLVSGVQLHVLPEGAVFDLAARQLVSTGVQPHADEAAELQAATEDLRELAAKIAAEGVSPSYYAERRRRASKRRADGPRS